MAVRRHARQSITVADQFLTWLHEQHQPLATTTQLDLEQWLATGNSTRTRVRPFIAWAVQSRTATGLTMPGTKSNDGPEMDHHHRLEWIRRCLTNTDVPRDERVATLLLLLYGQPLTRIAALPVSAVEVDESGNTFLRFQRVRTPVPEPFATLLLEHRDHRSPTRTTSGVESPWLFPGIRAGQHVTAQTMMAKIRNNGVDLRAARNAALRTLVREAPAPLIAKSLGYNDNTIHHHRHNIHHQRRRRRQTILLQYHQYLRTLFQRLVYPRCFRHHQNHLRLEYPQFQQDIQPKWTQKRQLIHHQHRHYTPLQ